MAPTALQIALAGLMAGMWLATPVNARGIHYGAVNDAGVVACDNQLWRGQRDAANRCYRALLTASSSLSTRAEVAWALGDVKSANDLFSAAIKQRSTPAVLTRWGELYAETHQNSEALKLFKEALQADANYAFAKVGAGSVLVDQFATQAGEYLQPVVEGAAPAGAKLRALLLAVRVNLENSDTDKAAELLKQATDVASAAQLPQLEIYALQASLELLKSPAGTDITASNWIKKALAENPSYGDIYAIPAHFYVITRRTREAGDLYKRAVEIQPDNWDARVEYGSSLLRDNRVTEAREQMEAAYKGDPYNVVTVNTLRLLDSFKNYDVLTYPEPGTATGNAAPIVLRLNKKESAVLAPYARKLTEAAVASYTKQFNFTLKEPVVIEVYPNHEDFAVRTAGEPGLGLLGVTFGYVVAMDSPSSRPIDEFHWGTTLWHELAHVFTLEATDHRVPRWFSEGISVYEEWNSGPIKGISIPGYAYEAFVQNKQLPVAELDRGFIRPETPQQVMISYMQAGLICEFIEREFGTAKFNEMLAQFKRGADTEKAVQAVFKIQPKEFDTRFTAFMQREFKTLFAKFDAWKNARGSVATAYKRNDWPGVIEAAQESLSILPNDVEDGSPYVALARAYNGTNKPELAQSTLETFFKNGGHDPEALRWLATRLRSQNKLSEAAQVLDAINYVTPFNYEVHGELGETLLTLKRPNDALTEFQAALQLNPPDKATAYYRVAQAMRDLQRTAEAKKNVLLALEVAPSFKPAQQLLLELAKTK
ncbi:MAG: tetratricopeptide repeat protein [Steroidobacteraceae bacterium]